MQSKGNSPCSSVVPYVNGGQGINLSAAAGYTDIENTCMTSIPNMETCRSGRIIQILYWSRSSNISVKMPPTRNSPIVRWLKVELM